jgi:hypothetical protein
MTIQKDLNAVSREMLKQASKIDKIVETLTKLESKKAKPTKTTARVKAVAKPTETKAAPKRDNKPTDTDKVISLIKRSKKGVDNKTLAKKTGFDQKKIWNIIYQGKRRGQIRAISRGLYIGA